MNSTECTIEFVKEGGAKETIWDVEDATLANKPFEANEVLTETATAFDAEGNLKADTLLDLVKHHNSDVNEDWFKKAVERIAEKPSSTFRIRLNLPFTFEVS